MKDKKILQKDKVDDNCFREKNNEIEYELSNENKNYGKMRWLSLIKKIALRLKI